MYYKPDPNEAYSSIQHITNDIFAGWLVRGNAPLGRFGVHYSDVHVGRVFRSARTSMRELNWIIGVLLLASGLGAGFSR